MNPFCAWIIIEWSLIKFVFFVMIWNPRWPPPQVIVLTQDHMGKYGNIFFPKTIALIEPKLCINHWKVLYKLCVFYVDQNSKMTTTAGHSFYIGPIGSFYNQVHDTGSWEALVVVSYLGLQVLHNKEITLIIIFVTFVWKVFNAFVSYALESCILRL
jgi:hypothetical protein